MRIQELKGVGEKTAQLLSRLEIYTTKDLVVFYPRDYDVYEEPALINNLNIDDSGKIIAVDAVISGNIEIYGGKGIKILSTDVCDVTGTRIKCVWYNMPFLKSVLRQGHRVVFRGRFCVRKGKKTIEQPAMFSRSEYDEVKGSMQPIYPLTKGISNKMIIKLQKQVLAKYNNFLEKEYISDVIRKKYKLSEHNFAVQNIHFPGCMEDYLNARKRLAFEEFFLFILAVRKLKENNERRESHYRIINDSRTDEFLRKLPYELTNAQKKTWQEIRNNLESEKLMSRLVQGDVGSGKTIIAILALMNTAFSGYQGALMAPTEVLAVQHYESVKELFLKYGVELNVSLLTGSMTAAEKRIEYEKISSGDTDIIIGTHALIQEKVTYKNLALVITDEQHRFGVNQRKVFSEKGMDPHVLVMSATPIPRTLAIIIYGDLDISVIDELPAGRVPIKNCVVDRSYRTKAYSFIKNQVEQGRQVYIICPMVEESEGLDCENVTDYTKNLRKEIPDIKIECLHGRMKPSLKNQIMNNFSEHRIDVLVSTTVIEVGVNVPNATVMMVENAERFGLAQLHQLRGRVGRGKYQSYCIFVAGNNSEKTMNRLEILNKTNDGFKIAEEDLRLRGPGDFFGIRQSGDFDFGIADIYADSRVLKNASEAADYVLSENPEFIGNDLLREKVSEYTEKCLRRINL